MLERKTQPRLLGKRVSARPLRARYRSNGEVEGPPKSARSEPRVHNLFRARGAAMQAVHGPLQRLLERTTEDLSVPVRVP